MRIQLQWNISRILLVVILLGMILTNCVGLDDQKLPKSDYDKISIENFQVNLERNFISGRLVNKSSYVVTSCVFEFKLYRLDGSRSSNSITYEANDGSTFTELNSNNRDTERKLVHSQKFLVREPLKKDYSTEFYFELKLDYDRGDYSYSKEIIDLKGR